MKNSDFGVSSIARAGAALDGSTTATIVDRHAPTEPTRPRGGSLTRTGMVLGTPAYMAPELAFGAKNAQPACDVFSVGVLPHELFTDARP